VAALSPLQAVVRRAGGVSALRHGRPVVIHYGSAAAELAVCLRAVGLVDRSELVKLDLRGAPGELGALLSEVIDGPPAPGGARRAGRAWWCAAAADRVVVLADPAGGRSLAERLRALARGRVHVAVADRSDAWAAIGLVGRAAPGLLARLGAYGPEGDPRAVAPFAPGEVGGAGVWWLLEADDRALCLAHRDEAPVAWRAIEDAGRGFGISCVGREAVDRLALVDRARARHAVPA
jgi:glycine cleavage system aminomethyltransferase T